MESRDYEKILDAMQHTGVYVIKADSKEVLYCNKRVREAVPGMRLGMICGEAVGGACNNCPLLTIGDKAESRAISYNDAFGGVVDIAAARTMWEDRVPAFVISISPHQDAAGYAYRKILRADLLQDRFRAVKPGEDGVREGILSAYLESFVKDGQIHPKDRERFLAFVRLEHLRKALPAGKEPLSCIYRRREGDSYRWNLLEVVRGHGYGEDNQTAVLGFKDVQGVMREGLERDEVRARRKKIIRTLGEENFGVYLIDLESGFATLVRLDGVYQDEFSARSVEWDVWLEVRVRELIHPAYREGIFSRFSLKSLRRAAATGQKNQKYIYLWGKEGAYRYVSASARLGEERDGRNYAVLAAQDVDGRVRQELAHTQRDIQMAAVLKSRYQIMNTVDLHTGLCERVFLDKVGTNLDSQSGDYEAYIHRAAEEFVHPEDRAEFLRSLSLDHLRKRAAEAGEYLEEVCRYRLRGEPVRWLEQHVIYSRQKPSLEGEERLTANILGRDITREREREENSSRALRDRTEIIRSMSGLFFSTYYVDLEEGTFRVVNQLGKVGEVLGGVVNYGAALEVYARNFIHPGDQKEYLRVMNLENWRETLRWWHPLVSMEYRKRAEVPGEKDCGWIRATAVLAQSTQEGMPQTVVYVAQDITEHKRRELLERRMLEETCRDIRDPVKAMVELAESAAGEKGPEAARFAEIAAQGRRILALTEGPEPLPAAREPEGPLLPETAEGETGKDAEM